MVSPGAHLPDGLINPPDFDPHFFHRNNYARQLGDCLVLSRVLSQVLPFPVLILDRGTRLNSCIILLKQKQHSVTIRLSCSTRLLYYLGILHFNISLCFYYSDFINSFAELYLEFLSLLHVSNTLKKNPYNYYDVRDLFFKLVPIFARAIRTFTPFS